MGAWNIGQAGAAGGGGYWLQEGIGGGSGLQQYIAAFEKPRKDDRCGFDSGRILCVKPEELGGEEEEGEEESRRRMVEMMLGPCTNHLAYGANHVQQQQQQPPPPTLDLLNAPLHFLHPHSIDSTPIELEPDPNLPSGWEKCLDLKTGSIYYLNRSTGLNSLEDPRKALTYHGKSGIADLYSWPASPTTSEITMDATLKSNAKQVALNLNEKCGGDEVALDLNLSLHVGQSSSMSPPQHVSVSVKACASLHTAKFKDPSSVPSASSSSSSTTSSPINSSFPFSHSSMSSAEPRPSPSSQDIKNTINNKQDSIHFSRFALKESPFCGGSMSVDQSLSGDGSHNAEISRLSEFHGHGSSNAPMVTVACANCLMFVMLSRSDPKCPRCGTCPDQLDFPQPPLKRAKLGFSF